MTPCQRCGLLPPPGSRYCSYCGEPVPSGPVPPPQAPAPPLGPGAIFATIIAIVAMLGLSAAFMVVMQAHIASGDGPVFSLPALFAPPAPSGYAAHKDQVRYGMSFDEVTRICGDPTHMQKIEVGGQHSALRIPYLQTVFMYYPGGYQLCFENGRLTGINNY